MRELKDRRYSEMIVHGNNTYPCASFRPSLSNWLASVSKQNIKAAKKIKEKEKKLRMKERKREYPSKSTEIW